MRGFHPGSSLVFMALLLPGSLGAGSDPLKKVSHELAEAIARQSEVRVGVWALPYYDNFPSEGPFLVSERIATHLAADRRFRVVERNRMTELLRELHLSQSGLLDARTAKLLGKILGAEVIVTGTLIDVDDGRTEINARGLLSGTGRIVAASRAVMARTWEGRKTLGLRNDSRAASAAGSDPLRPLARRLSKPIRQDGTLSVAVMNFPYARGRIATGSYLCSERMVTGLVQENVAVIERQLLKKILEERLLWETGAVDAASVKKIGKIAGVDALVVGTLTDLNETSAQLVVRLIRVDTGQVLAAETARIPRFWSDTPRLPYQPQIRLPTGQAGGPVRVTIPVEEEPAARPRLKKTKLALRGKGGQYYYPIPVPVPYGFTKAGRHSRMPQSGIHSPPTEGKEPDSRVRGNDDEGGTEP